MRRELFLIESSNNRVPDRSDQWVVRCYEWEVALFSMLGYHRACKRTNAKSRDKFRLDNLNWCCLIAKDKTLLLES
jgi:hypothetical protein